MIQMWQINLVKLGFFTITAGIATTAGLLTILRSFTPKCIQQLFFYGKFAFKGNVLFVNKLELPRSYFKHFYIFSVAYVTLALLVAVNVYVYGSDVPLGFLHLMDLTVGIDRQATVSSTSVLCALSLLAIQCYRRLYETHFVSVFSQHSMMNLSHYLVGYAHYAGAIGAILGEAPYFAPTDPSLLNDSFQIHHIVAICLFFWGWVHQYRATLILADLRKDIRGIVVSQDYKIPQGDWFDYLSAPHVVSEIIMYAALTIILWGNSTWLYCFAWVLINQSIVAVMNHKWYEETFPNYPPQRKALVPGVY